MQKKASQASSQDHLLDLISGYAKDSAEKTSKSSGDKAAGEKAKAKGSK